jgi:hypothetical protein
MSIPKIYVLHENDEWTAPLERELSALGSPFECWHLDAGSLALDVPPPAGIFYSRMSASAHTRDHRYAPEFTAAVLRWLQAHKRTVLNGAEVLALEVSKVAQQSALNMVGIVTPRTIAAVGREHILAAARSFDGVCILKHNRGGKGLGVHKFDDAQAVEAYLDGPAFEAPIDGIMLVQAYIRAPKPYITRCEFIGGEFLYALRVNTEDGFELCPADFCVPSSAVCAVDEQAATTTPKFEIVTDVPTALIDQYRTFLKANDIAVAGIEFIVDEDGLAYTYDVNTNTNYNSGAEQRAGHNAMAGIARFLTRELARASGTLEPLRAVGGTL